MKINPKALEKGPRYSDELGIKLGKHDDKEYFKWFLASLLFGARISETIAKNTYRAFARYQLLTPRKILRAGWDFLVNPIMREGGYVRYDGRKSTQILSDCKKLTDEYGGSLIRLHSACRDSQDLETRLLDFYGIGVVTANIFLRELRPYWKRADPEPLAIVRELAKKWKLNLGQYDRHTMKFVRVEAGLIRSRRVKAGVSGLPHSQGPKTENISGRKKRHKLSQACELMLVGAMRSGPSCGLTALIPAAQGLRPIVQPSGLPLLKILRRRLGGPSGSPRCRLPWLRETILCMG